MKALSIRQPWAWLVATGRKDIENRTWQTKFRGRVYIHTGKKVDDPRYTHLLKHRKDGGLLDDFAMNTIAALRAYPIGSVIIGEVDIVDCTFRFGGENDNLYSPWHEPGCWGFKLANPVWYGMEKYISCKGKLGFFEPQAPESKHIP